MATHLNGSTIERFSLKLSSHLYLFAGLVQNTDQYSMMPVCNCNAVAQYMHPHPCSIKTLL